MVYILVVATEEVECLWVSPYTKEELKAYTSLDGYNFSIQGWVSNIRILSLGEVSLLLADVKHSRKLTATPLHPWIALHSLA